MSEDIRQQVQVSLWSPIRLAHGLLPVVSMLERHAIEADRILERAGIDRFGLMDPAYTISIEQELNFLKAVIRALPNPAMSLEMAQEYRLRGFSVLGLAMQSASSPLEMLQLLAGYPRLAWGMFDGQLDIAADVSRIHFLPQPRLGAAEGFLLERDIACALVLFEEASEAIFPLQSVSFRHQCATDVQIYEDFFHCPVHFGADRNELLSATEVIQQPLPHAEPTMCAFYSAQCARMSKDMEQVFTYTEAVRSRLLANTEVPDLERLAKSMFMTPRTLQRRLKTEDVAFSDLLQQAREQRAQQLLRETDMSVEQVAGRLGFSDAVAFSHAFKSWLGQAPGAWRKAHKDSAS